MIYIVEGNKVSREKYVRYKYYEALKDKCAKWGLNTFTLDYAAEFFEKVTSLGDDKAVEVLKTILDQSYLVKSYEQAEATKGIAENQIAKLDAGEIRRTLSEYETEQRSEAKIDEIRAARSMMPGPRSI